MSEPLHAGIRIYRADIPPASWLVTAPEAAERACVPVGTVWSWASRGKIAAVGAVDGRPLYNLADVMRVEQQTRRTPRRRRLLAVAINECKDHTS